MGTVGHEPILPFHGFPCKSMFALTAPELISEFAEHFS